MKLKTIQSEYIQKSKIYLYPLLGIRRGVSVTPIQTYMSWEGHYTVKDCKFIGLYHLREDKEFKELERKLLLDNKYFEEFFDVEGDKRVYVFDFSTLRDEYMKIKNGKYSNLTSATKEDISEFFRKHHNHHTFVLSYLDPDRFMSDYAELLAVDVAELQSVGELCSPPDLSKENLKVKKKIRNFESENKLSTDKLKS